MRAFALSLPLLVTAIVTFSPSASFAQGPGPSVGAQSCDTIAAERRLSGNARKNFLSECMSERGASGTSTGNVQQEKIRSCNIAANSRQLTGGARERFVSSCLRGR